MNNQITLTADIIEFSDNTCREELRQIRTKIESLNKRINNQASDIRELKALIKLKEKKDD